MSRLVIALPLQAATAQTELNYVISNDAIHVDRIGKARAEALPRLTQPGDECIAVVPPSLLSWHLTNLPDGVAPGSTRMRAVLAGLLVHVGVNLVNLHHIKELTNSMSFLCSNDIIIGLVLLKHQPHCFDIIPRKSPISLGIQVA